MAPCLLKKHLYLKKNQRKKSYKCSQDNHCGDPSRPPVVCRAKIAYSTSHDFDHRMEMTRSVAFIVGYEVQHGLEQHILELFINTIIYCLFCPKRM